MKVFAASVLPAVLLSASPAPAQSWQFENGDFESGAIEPWVSSVTQHGATLGPSVQVYDIDGPGPQPPSLAVRYMVGKTGPAIQGWEGAQLAQAIPLIAGRRYEFSFQYSVKPLVNVYNQSGGRFDLIVNGEAVASVTAPATTGLATTYGMLRAVYFAPQSGPFNVGVRITRPTVFGEEVMQYVDNFSSGWCYPDCNGCGCLSIAQFACFQNRFVLGDVYADCNADGVLTVADFGCFQTQFILGCQ